MFDLEPDVMAIVERIEGGETVDLNELPVSTLIELGAFCTELEATGDERHPELRRRVKKLQAEADRFLDDFIAGLDF